MYEELCREFHAELLRRLIGDCLAAADRIRADSPNATFYFSPVPDYDMKEAWAEVRACVLFEGRRGLDYCYLRPGQSAGEVEAEMRVALDAAKEDAGEPASEPAPRLAPTSPRRWPADWHLN